MALWKRDDDCGRCGSSVIYDDTLKILTCKCGQIEMDLDYNTLRQQYEAVL